MKRVFASFLLLALLLTGCGSISPEAPAETPSEHLVIHYIDVDQADGMLLMVGETTILIDGGNLDTTDKLVHYLRQHGVEELDLMVNTHPHMDHMGGLSTAMNFFPTKEIWCSHETYDSTAFQFFANTATQNGLTITHPEPGTAYAADGLIIEVIGPVQEAEHYFDLNDTSLVLMITYGQKRFLFTGDMEKYAEQQLLASGVNLKADVLKVGHHGSYSSTHQRFLDEVDPDYAVISCGRDNEYGHPHNDPVTRLKNADVELFRTDLMGNVVLVTDGQTIAFLLSTRDLEVDGYDQYQSAA